MKKLLLFLTFISINLVHGQLVVNNTAQTPAQLVQNVLLGTGITVSNIKFNGSVANANVVNDQVGKFTGGNTTNIGINSGVLLSTGKGSVAIGPNNSASKSLLPSNASTGDSDLDILTTASVNNKAVLEFDFVPTGQNLSFNFVFGSEEYLEWVGGGFNDVFGFS